MVSTTAELREAFAVQCATAGLQMECGMHGTFQAQLAIIAEAPGRNEVAQGIPLVGGAGQILWKSLRTYIPEIKRHECYVTNVVKRQVSFDTYTVGSGADVRKPVGKHELSGWQQLLMWELSQLPNLKYLLLLGNYALEAVHGITGVTNWRGSILSARIDDKDVTTVTTFNPAFCAREPATHVIFDMDIADKLKPVFHGTYKPHDVVTHINPTTKQALDYIKHCENGKTPVASDIEVISNETACIGLANGSREAMCIAFRTEEANIYSQEDEAQIRRAAQRLYTSPQVRLVWQNGGFDTAWLWFKDKIKCKPAFGDTMLGHHVLYPPMPHDLGFIVKQYTMHPYYKGEKDEWRHTGGVDNFWRYNGKDCALTYASHEGILHELRTQHLDRFYVEHVMRLQSHLVWMTVGGVAVDTTLKDKLAEDLGKHVDTCMEELMTAITDATGDPTYKPNPNSPKQMAELYFSKLKLVGRGVSTDATNRGLMFKHPRTDEKSRRVLQAVGKYATEAKFYSTYATMQPDYDCRMRCDYRQTGVRNAPGRLSSAQTLWGSGGNLQNIPDRAKEMFIADDDCVFIYIDGAQAEARVVGWRYGIETWIEQFERARLDGVYDAHRALASEMFRIPYDEVPTFDRYPLDEASAFRDGIPYDASKRGQVTVRFVAKRCRHGLNYRMMPDRLALTTGLPISVATEAFTLYHRVNPQIKKGWEQDLFLVREYKEIFNALGRRYRQMVPVTEESTESIVAFYPQSTIGDHVCSVIYRSHDDSKWPTGKARIVLNTHDGLVGIARKDYAKQALRVMVKHAERPLMIQCIKEKTKQGKYTYEPRQLIIPADAAMSVPGADGIHRWSTIKKMKRSALFQ